MPDNPYLWYGTDIPRMLGRTALFDSIHRFLNQDTPPHLSIIGPKRYGKTVFLNHLAEHFSSGNDRYLTSIYWDIRHDPPTSDTQLRRRFAELMQQSLQPSRSDLAEYIDLADEETISDGIESILEELNHEPKVILAVLDGFDALPLGTSITHNILGQMRAWAQYPSLRFVIGSRARLQDLCKSEETADSDFWRIFYDPIQIERFEDIDWHGLLAPFENIGIQFDDSARKELINQTGGVPVLTVGFLGEFFDKRPEKATLTGDVIKDFADQEKASLTEQIKDLWEDCDIDMQTILATIQTRPMQSSEISTRRLEMMTQRGFIQTTRQGIRSACQLMESYVQQEESAVTDIRRLFGDADRYEKNIQSLLELRLSHLQGVDPELYNKVEKAIRDLHPNPADSINWMRNIVERAMDLIWNKELPANLSLPQDWKYQWQQDGELRGMGGANSDISAGRLPRRRGGQCRVLNLMTGTLNTPPAARYVTKSTYLLIDYLQSVGDFGQHIENNRVDIGFAASVCLSAIELCESWQRDLEKENG